MNIRNAVAVLAVACASSAAHALVINVHDANNFATPNDFSHKVNLYTGQGAYSDPGHNTWNSFPDNGDPQPVSLVDSAGSPTSVTFSSTGAANNSGLLYTTAFGYKQADGTNLATGKPAFLLGEWEQSGAPIVVTLAGIPAGTYSLYGYDSSVDYDRGASFAVLSGAGSTGTAHGGKNYTENHPASLSAPATQGGLLSLTGFTENENYARIDGIVVGNDGVLTVTVAARQNAVTGNNGEVNFNGLQLVSAPEPASLAAAGLGAVALLSRKRRSVR